MHHWRFSWAGKYRLQPRNKLIMFFQHNHRVKEWCKKENSIYQIMVYQERQCLSLYMTRGHVIALGQNYACNFSLYIFKTLLCMFIHLYIICINILFISNYNKFLLLTNKRKIFRNLIPSLLMRNHTANYANVKVKVAIGR
jgi:hypothetical protein